jgi:SAM-dependent methyltransferase
MESVKKHLFGDYNPYSFTGEMLPEDAQGWNSDSAVFLKLLEIEPKLIVEVGTWKGASAIHMANILKENYTDFEIVCVDTWCGNVEHWNPSSEHSGWFKNNLVNGRPTIYDQFRSNIVHKGLTDYITPFPIDSINAFEWFKVSGIMVDAIYIDAGHDYNSVRMDLSNWAHVLRPGGYLIGDDWFHHPIKQAAYDTFGDKVVEMSHDKFLWIK